MPSAELAGTARLVFMVSVDAPVPELKLAPNTLPALVGIWSG